MNPLKRTLGRPRIENPRTECFRVMFSKRDADRQIQVADKVRLAWASWARGVLTAAADKILDGRESI